MFEIGYFYFCQIYRNNGEILNPDNNLIKYIWPAYFRMGVRRQSINNNPIINFNIIVYFNPNKLN